MIGPSTPAHLIKRDDEDKPLPSASNPIAQLSSSKDHEEEDEDAWAPALPPDLEPPPARVIGPPKPASMPMSAPTNDQYDSDDDYGPMPLPAGAQMVDDVGSGVHEFIQREEHRKKELEV
jgi:hypothetical protein